MNTDTLDRALLYKLDAIRQAGTLISATWQPEERHQALTDGYREVCKLVRRQRQDWHTVHRRSTDATTFIRTENYNPTSFRLVAGTATYTLPPDLLELRFVRCVTAGREHVAFELVAENQDEGMRVRRRPDPTAGQQGTRFLCILTGQRSMVVVPTPQETLELELVYVTQPRRLVLYSTGTITTVNGSTALLTAGSADWTERASGIVVGDEILIGTSATAPTASLDARYPRLLTGNTGGTEAGLAEPYLGATGGALLYRLASVPDLPEDWHYAIVFFAVWALLAKSVEEGQGPAAERAWQDWQRIAAALIPESAQRDSQDLQVAEDGWAVFEGEAY